MSEVQRFRYPSEAMFKDYAQAVAGTAIFGAPLIFAGANVYLAVILGAIVLMFVGFGFNTGGRHHSGIVVTDDGIGMEGARNAGISWRGIERVELRYFSTRRQRGRIERGDEGKGWMQLRLDGEGVTLRIDSALDGFDGVARRSAEAIERFGLNASPTTKGNFAALGLAPDRSWAEGV